MGIETVTVCKVTCQKCPATRLVPDWRDAAEFGWCVPIDGHLHLCPACLAKQQDEMSVLATKARIYQACVDAADKLCLMAFRPDTDKFRCGVLAVRDAIRDLAESQDNIGLREAGPDVQAASGSTNGSE